MICERMIPHSNSWGKWKKQCSKTAIYLDNNGRKLCSKCGRKHQGKGGKIEELCKEI